MDSDSTDSSRSQQELGVRRWSGLHPNERIQTLLGPINDGWLVVDLGGGFC